MVIYIIISMVTLCLTDRACAKTIQYCVMLDAGSSGTTVIVYSWPERRSTSSTFNITEEFSQKIKPSLSSFKDDLNSVSQYILNMTSIAESKVPSYSHNRSHVYLFATAGLRFLEEEKAINLMNTVRSVLSDKRSHKFKYSERSVRIISGEEEGVFAWITANYHNGFLASNQSLSKGVGVLEMGGGSTQITFLPDGPLLAHMFTLRIAGRIYNLYSHSYLNFGMNYMHQRIDEYLIEHNPRETDILNPCTLINDSYTYDTGDKTVTFRGSGSPSECFSIISSFLKEAHDTCYPKPCAIGSIYQPSVGSDKFYAIAVYAYVTTDLNATDSSGRLHIDKLNKTAHIYCTKTIEYAVSVYKIRREYASRRCMMGLYITELLTFSYGFPVNTDRIYSSLKINGKSLDWTFGAVLYENELLADNYPCPPISSSISAGVPQVNKLDLLEWLLILCFLLYT
ncbi:ectonucleoside triphosphate diphosphohydrolase 3-like [Saccostrea echinata]|uniref:ectonucleoside triphosphate diphosphohydrolase 3-like n=1 Tax=Saccostrea echinata TaxID=191078 RepID=UPI002A828684|nr:ectonucleoside triphosphate diphosphohydrolase 3-like [Saccostrea echinata]